MATKAKTVSKDGETDPMQDGVDRVDAIADDKIIVEFQPFQILGKTYERLELAQPTIKFIKKLNNAMQGMKEKNEKLMETAQSPYAVFERAQKRTTETHLSVWLLKEICDEVDIPTAEIMLDPERVPEDLSEALGEALGKYSERMEQISTKQ